MPDALACPHCDMPIEGADDVGDSLTACPHCHGPLTPLSAAHAPTPLPPSNSRPTADIRFTFACERCASILEATSIQCNHVGRCPTCGATFTIPAIDPHSAVPLNKPRPADDGQLPTPMHAYAAAGARAPKIERDPGGAQSIICPRCAGRSPVEANLCAACGTPFTMEGATEITRASGRMPRRAAAALILGLLICLPVGPIAMTFGLLALRDEPQGGKAPPGHAAAWAGIVLGVIGSLVWIAAIVS